MGKPPQSAQPAPGRGRRALRRVLIYLLIALFIWGLAVWFLQRRVLFPTYLIPPPGAAPGEIELLVRPTEAGPVEAFFLPGEGVSAETPGPAVIFAHGNGELIDHWPRELAGYRAMGVSVLLPEYRGYGRSAGRPSQAAIVADYVAFHDQLAVRPEVDAGRIFYHGRSVGGGVVAALATRRRPAAMILQSTFTSVADLARRYFVPRVLVRDPFDVRPILAAYEGPVLILHGRHDEIASLEHARRNHAAARYSRLILYDVDHNTLPEGAEYWRDIERFLREDAGLLR